MFSWLGGLNALSICNIFQFMMGLLGCNPIVNQGRSVYIHTHILLVLYLEYLANTHTPYMLFSTLLFT